MSSDAASPDAVPSSEAQAASRHVPVLRDRITELLSPSLSGSGSPVVVDATLGMGGHAEALLRAHAHLQLIGLDRDAQALELAGKRLAPFRQRVHLVQSAFDALPDVLAEQGVREIHGAVFDLGVSSLQLDEAERGFAYAQDAPLDMRMNPQAGLSAAEVLNTYSVGELTRILREYGEEKFAAKIAHAISAQRQRQPFANSAELVELLYRAIPAASRRSGGHPAKRTFQALRIEVNGELDQLRTTLPAALDHLAFGGRVAVLAYHSLEDRIVKQELARRSRSTTPVELPVELPGHEPEFRLLTRGAEQASAEETTANPRAAAVRLRAAERIKEAR